ncbi:MAG: tRNA pseudouridine(38-40) synthase TruA, partial [Sphingomonadales bacterium]|nr:tRNA pseudouridine(38-40) synthase TruA [Sphingomonadales bacterium]
MRYKIELAFNGSNYAGWQIQPNAPTVQSAIDKALSTLCNQP